MARPTSSAGDRRKSSGRRCPRSWSSRVPALGRPHLRARWVQRLPAVPAAPIADSPTSDNRPLSEVGSSGGGERADVPAIRQVSNPFETLASNRLPIYQPLLPRLVEKVQIGSAPCRERVGL